MTVSCSESEDQADVTPLHVTGRFDDSTDEVPAWRFDIEANVDQVAAGAVHDLATIDGNDGYDDTRTSVLVMASEGRDRSVTYGDVPGASGRLRFIRASCGETSAIELEIDGVLAGEDGKPDLKVSGSLIATG